LQGEQAGLDILRQSSSIARRGVQSFIESWAEPISQRAFQPFDTLLKFVDFLTKSKPTNDRRAQSMSDSIHHSSNFFTHLRTPLS
jgi:hypothetical protein